MSVDIAFNNESKQEDGSKQKKSSIRIITVAYNRPEFITLQFHSLSKYMKADWEFLVFSDAEVNRENNDHKIKAICRKLQIQHIRVPPYIQIVSGPSPRAGNALDWALKNYAYNYDGITLVLDSDMFLVKEFEPYSFMNTNCISEFDLAGVIQTVSYNGYWIRYLWMALMVINGRSIRNKNPDQIRFMNAVAIEGQATDAGGPMHYYLSNHPNLKIKPLKHLWSHSWDESQIQALGPFDNSFIEYMKIEKGDPRITGIGEMVSHYFYHYRAGSNWNSLSQEVIESRISNLQEYFEKSGILNKSRPQVQVIRSKNKSKEFIEHYPHYILELDDNFQIVNSETKETIIKVTEHIKVTDDIKIIEDIKINENTKLTEFIEVTEDIEVIEELILLHEQLHNPTAILNLEIHNGSSEELFIKSSNRSKNCLWFYRPGLPKSENTATAETWNLGHIPYSTLFEEAEVPDDKKIGFSRLFKIKKQHHYQIVIVGKVLDPMIRVQLCCRGDTFFGALDAIEFSLGLEMSMIVWDFYNKFETLIGISLTIEDNRSEEKKKAVPVHDLIKVKKSYLVCIEELA